MIPELAELELLVRVVTRLFQSRPPPTPWSDFELSASRPASTSPLFVALETSLLSEDGKTSRENLLLLPFSGAPPSAFRLELSVCVCVCVCVCMCVCVCDRAARAASPRDHSR